QGNAITTSSADPVIGANLESVLDRYKYVAKLVDLDVDQQGVSQIWGLQLRVGIPNPAQPDQWVASVTGTMPPTAFADLWFRLRGAPGMDAFSATYQAELTDLTWQNESASPLLTQLKQASSQALSIRFVVDSFQSEQTAANFRLGRIVGTLGPAFPGEPTAFVQGRRLSAPASADTFTSPPYGGVYAKVDLAREVLTIDLGNFSPTV